MADSLIRFPMGGYSGEEATVLASQVAHWRYERGSTYTILHLHLKDGHTYSHRDYSGSAHKLETKIETAVEAFIAGQAVAANG